MTSYYYRNTMLALFALARVGGWDFAHKIAGRHKRMCRQILERKAHIEPVKATQRLEELLACDDFLKLGIWETN